jgi:hypothetical protein
MVVLSNFLTGQLARTALGQSIEGTSSRETRDQARQLIPYSQMTPQANAKLKQIVDSPTIFRRMPVQQIDCDEEMFTFLVRYPEVLVNLWDLMGVTNVIVDRTGPYEFSGDDGAGTLCNGELIYGNDRIHVYYGTGSYDGPMIPKALQGRSVCVLHSQTIREPDGQVKVRGFMDVFIKVDNRGVGLLAQAISPFVTKTADYNFVESSKFLAQLSQVAERRPDSIETIANRMTKIAPAVRDEFIAVAYRAAERSIAVARGNTIFPADQFNTSMTSPGENQTDVARSDMANRSGETPLIIRPSKPTISLRR